MPHAKDFELAVRELIDSRRKDTHRDIVAQALRTQAELVARDDEWPAQAGTDMKPDYVPAEQQPTEAEMKNAAAARKANEMAEERDIKPTYTENPQIDTSAPEEEQAEQRKKREDDILGSDSEREALKKKPGATTKTPLTGKDTPKTA